MQRPLVSKAQQQTHLERKQQCRKIHVLEQTLQTSKKELKSYISLCPALTLSCCCQTQNDLTYLALNIFTVPLCFKVNKNKSWWDLQMSSFSFIYTMSEGFWNLCCINFFCWLKKSWLTERVVEGVCNRWIPLALEEGQACRCHVLLVLSVEIHRLERALHQRVAEEQKPHVLRFYSCFKLPVLTVDTNGSTYTADREDLISG